MLCFEKSVDEMFRPLMICLVFFIGCLSCCPAALAEDRRLPVNEISVAVAADYPPYYFQDETGRAVGWVVDIWRQWSQKTGIKVDFVSAPWDETLRLVREGKVDVHGGLFYSPERGEYLDYVAPLTGSDDAFSSGGFFFHNSIYGIDDLKDLLGFRIGVVKGDYVEGFLREHLPGASLVPFDNADDLFQSLEDGDIRVFAIEIPAGIHFLKTWHMLPDFNYYPDKPLYSNLFHAAVKKGNTALVPIVEKGLKAITPEELADIQERWGVKRTRSDDTLRIVCDRYYPPFTMLTTSGRASGMLVDLWRLWAKKVNRKIEFVFGDWKDTIRLLEEGKADIHSGLYKTPEREAIFSLSSPLLAAQDSLAFKTDQKQPGMNELAGEKLGVIQGSAEEARLRETHPDIILFPYVGFRGLVDALQRGEVMAAYDVAVTLQHVIEELGFEEEIQVAKQVGPIRHIYAGVLKGNDSLLMEINRGINDITNQELQEIEDQWVSNPDLRHFSGSARPLILTEEEKHWLKEHPQIRLGIDPGFMPFEAVGPNGVYEGLSSDYVSLLSKKLGVDMTPLRDLSWQEAMNAARTCEVDVLPCVAVTPERNEFLLFTRPYLQFPTVAVTRRDAPFIAGLEGLKGARVAVVKGYFIREMLERDFPEINLVSVDNIEQGLKAVDEGKVAAFIDNSASVIYSINKFHLKDLRSAVTTPYPFNLRFAVRKDWPQLAPILEKALQSIPAQERERIANQWINVRFAERTDWGFVLKAGMATALVIGLILIVILFWNRRLVREAGERKRAEDRFNSIAASAPGAIIQVRFDPESRPEYLYLSARAEEFFQMPPEQVIERKERLPWHPEDLTRIKEEIRANLSSGSEMNHVGRIVTREGAVKWIRLNASPRRSSEGERIYSGFILDITERKLAELEYLRSERKINAMSQAMSDALVMLNGKGVVLFWNQAAEKLFGYKTAEAMGMDFHEIAAPAEVREKARAGLGQFAATGKGNVFGAAIEMTAMNRQGQYFPVEVRLSPLQVDDEWFAVGTVRDITERKQAEEKASIFFNASDDGLMLLSPEKGFIHANRAAVEMLRFNTLDELLQCGPPDISPEFQPDGRPSSEAAMAHIAAALESGAAHRFEWMHKRTDNSLIPCEVTLIPITLAGETQLLASIRDITERKEAEDSLRESEQRVQGILNSINTGVIVIDPEKRAIVDVNPVAAKMIGLNCEDIIGHICHQFICPRAVNDCPVLDNDQKVENAERVLVTAAGEEIPILKTVTQVELGGKRRLLESFIDISEQKKAEHALRQAGNEQIAIFESLTLGIALVKDRIIIRGNRRLGDLFGRPLEEMIGQTTRIWYRNEEEYLGVGASSYEDLKRQEVHEREQQLPRKDGSLFWCSFRVRMVDPGDISKGIVCALEDVTERKRAEEELKEKMEELERFSRLTINREGKMIELKEEINTLLEQTGREKKYKIVE